MWPLEIWSTNGKYFNCIWGMRAWVEISQTIGGLISMQLFLHSLNDFSWFMSVLAKSVWIALTTWINIFSWIIQETWSADILHTFSCQENMTKTINGKYFNWIWDRRSRVKIIQPLVAWSVCNCICTLLKISADLCPCLRRAAGLLST